MKYNILPALLLIFALSCSKEKKPTEPQPATDPIPQFAMSAAKLQNTSKLLKREVSYIKDNPLLKNVRLFTYDNLNRCTEIKIGTIDSAINNPVFTLKQTLTFNYNGPSAVMPSSFASVRTVFPNLVTTYYYTYNSDGRKIKDSVRVKNMAGEPADIVINYVYEDDRVYATPVLRGFPSDNVMLDTLSLLSGGNIEKLTSRRNSPLGVSLVTYAFTYDKAISPYNQLNIANSLYFEHSSLGIGYNVPLETHYMGVTTNNMTSWSFGSNTVRFTYWYDVDNYPLRKQQFLLGDTEPSKVTLFEY